MWTILFALPNLNLKEPVGNYHISIVPHNDPRIKEITSDSELAEIFVENFENQFRKKCLPSFLIENEDSSLTDDYGIVCYRNALALSTIIKGHEHNFAHPHRAYPIYSDNFDFYPLIFSHNQRSFITQTPDQLEISHVFFAAFRGQRSPGLSTAGEPYRISNDLFNLLEKVWEMAFIKAEKPNDWPTLALFRSLEMAYRASAMPMKNLGTDSDYGTSASLWVSALEILSHPRTARVKLQNVLELLVKYPWKVNRSMPKRYDLRSRKGPVLDKGNISQKLYCEIYDTRNDFLHGNPIRAARLHPFKNTSVPYIIRFAPLIYKLALLVHLERFKTKWDLLIWPASAESKLIHDKRLSDIFHMSKTGKVHIESFINDT